MEYEVQNFETDVLKRSQEVPILVDFWAPWCGPCKMLGPVLEKLAEEAGGRWVLAKLNTEEHLDLASQFDIRSIPNVKLFYRGEVVNEFLGALPEAQIRQWLTKALPSPQANEIEKARRLISEGEHFEAAKLLEVLMQTEPDNHEIRVLFSEALLRMDPSRVETVLQGVGADSDFAHKAEGIRHLSRLVLLAVHPEKLPEDPVREKFLEGAKAVQSGDFGAALKAFIEVVQRNRKYGEEGAKHACKAIFQYLGPRHPVTEEYFRAFSSALYA